MTMKLKGFGFRVMRIFCGLGATSMPQSLQKHGRAGLRISCGGWGNALHLTENISK